MFDPMLDARVVEQRKQDMLRQARLHHLRRQMRASSHTLPQRWLTLIADVMVRTGTQLQRRCANSRLSAAPADAPLVGWERL